MQIKVTYSVKKKKKVLQRTFISKGEMGVPGFKANSTGSCKPQIYDQDCS